MLVDSGTAIERSDLPPDQPAIEIKPPKPPEKNRAKAKADKEPKAEKKAAPKKDRKSKAKSAHIPEPLAGGV